MGKAVASDGGRCAWRRGGAEHRAVVGSNRQRWRAERAAVISRCTHIGSCSTCRLLLLLSDRSMTIPALLLCSCTAATVRAAGELLVHYLHSPSAGKCTVRVVCFLAVNVTRNAREMTRFGVDLGLLCFFGRICSNRKEGMTRI